jgi:hypothetical protein
VEILVMHRKTTVLLTVVITGLVLSLGYNVVMLRDLQDLQNQLGVLQNENTELQDSLNTFPFVQEGRAYLDGLNKTTGKILSIQLEEKAPIYYYNYTDEDIARAKETGEILPLGFFGEPRLCWVIKFEQAKRPGHYFEVWIDASTSEIIGMDECLGS